MELGSVERFRFIGSPELHPYQDAGGAIGSTGLVSTTGANIDVYPMIIVGMDAWADLAMRGRGSMDIVDLPPTRKDKADILGQRGYVGAKFWAAPYIQNDGWMAVYEIGVTTL